MPTNNIFFCLWICPIEGFAILVARAARSLGRPEVSLSGLVGPHISFAGDLGQKRLPPCELLLALEILVDVVVTKL